MDLFSVDFTLGEIQLLRQSLDVITIVGKDAKPLASLQMKLENEIASIQELLKEAELRKHQELLQALESNKKTKAKG